MLAHSPTSQPRAGDRNADLPQRARRTYDLACGRISPSPRYLEIGCSYHRYRPSFFEVKAVREFRALFTHAACAEIAQAHYPAAVGLHKENSESAEEKSAPG